MAKILQIKYETSFLFLFLIAFVSKTSATSFIKNKSHSNPERIIEEIISRINDQKQEVKHESQPFVMVTYAQTLDGSIAINYASKEEKSNSSSNLILSCPDAFRLTHALRANFDAILVGGNTLSTDNPRLNNRLWKEKNGECKQPVPIILDTNLRHAMKLVNANDQMRCAHSHDHVIICCNKSAYKEHSHIIEDYCKRENVKIKLHVCESNKDGLGIDVEMMKLSLSEDFGIMSLMVEGGSRIITSFLSSPDQIDCVCITTCPRLLTCHGLKALHSSQSGDEAATPEMLEFVVCQWYTLGTDSIFLGIK